VGVDGRAGKEGLEAAGDRTTRTAARASCSSPSTTPEADHGRVRSPAQPLRAPDRDDQIKGNSEVHRKFWPADEFAGFENADSVGTFKHRTSRRSTSSAWAVIRLDYQQKLGVNPYHLGFTGGKSLSLPPPFRSRAQFPKPLSGGEVDGVLTISVPLEGH